MKRCLLVAMMMTGAAMFARAAETPEAPKAAAMTTDERIAAMEKAVLKKLAAIEDRLDRMEKDRTAESRKADLLARDVSDIRRDVQRLEARK